MRIIILAALGLSAGCGRGGSAADSATHVDTVTVAGPPAVPSTQASSPTASPPAATTTSTTRGTQPAPPPTTKAGAATTTVTDSIRGIVSITGTSFEKHVMIAERGTQRRLEVIGALSTMIARVAGTEVSATGVLSGTQLEANRFIVRAADGQPAIDGTLKTEGGSLFIVTAEGTRTRIATPPPPLIGKDGARVWITGDPAKAVASFGFIDPAR